MNSRRRILGNTLIAPLLGAAAFALPASEHNKAGEWLTLRDYGAVGDGVTDDTNAVRAAVQGGAEGRPIIVPNGKFRVKGPINCGGLVNLMGFGAETSEVLFDEGATIRYDGSAANDFDSGQITVRQVGFRCLSSRSRKSGPVLDINFTDGRGGTTKSAIIEDLEVSGVTDGAGFDCAVRLNNARNLKIDGLRIRGDRSNRSGAIGLDITGEESPVDMFISKISCYFLEKGINISGNVEGVYLTQSVFVAVDFGVYAHLGHASPLLFVQGCHINAFRGCIDLNNVVQFDISHNLFYASKPKAHLNRPGGEKIGFVAIAIGMHEAIGVTSRITGNTIIGTSQIDIPKNGVYVDGEKSEFSLTLDGNELVGWDTAVILGTGANGVLVTASNRFRSNREQVLDISRRNRFATSSLSPNGYSRSDEGLETKWGSGTIKLDESGTGRIFFTEPFVNKLFVCVVSNASPGQGSVYAVDMEKSSRGEVWIRSTPPLANMATTLTWIALGT